MKSLRVLLHAAAVVSLAACASGGGGNNSTVAPTPDPRVGLKAGLKDAGQAAWNLKLLTNVPPSEKFVGSTNSDLSFYKNYVIQGNYNGFEVWDITTPSRAGGADRRLGAIARGGRVGAHPVRTHRGQPEGRDRPPVALARRPARSRAAPRS